MGSAYSTWDLREFQLYDGFASVHDVKRGKCGAPLALGRF